MNSIFKLKFFVFYCCINCLSTFAQNNLLQGLSNTQWSISGNVVDESYFMGTKNQFPLKIKTNDIERLRITSAGLVGIGTLSPQAQLDVNGNVIFRNNIMFANITQQTSLGGKGVLLTDEFGNLTKSNLEQIGNEIYFPNNACRVDQNGNVPNPTWANGLNKIFTVCEPVNVGIGTDNPNFKLHVIGTTYSSVYKGAEGYLNGRMVIGSNDINSSNFAKLLIKNSTNSASIMIDQTALNGDYSKVIYAEIQNPTTEIIKVNNPVLNYVPFLLTASGAMEIHNGTRKTFNLDADGLLKTRRIIVDQDEWPDYVFDKNYTLMPLTDVEKYIKTNKHLPEVPSEKETETNGSDLGEMNAILLKKIEELTLYLIEQDKKLTQQALELEQIKKQMK